MKTLVKILGYILYIPACLLFFFELYRTIFQVVIPQYKIYTWFCVGALAYILLGLLFKKNKIWFQTFFHELTHTLVSILFFRKIHSFTAERGEGVMSYSTGRFKLGDTMISLSPYFLPIFAIFFMLIKPAINGDAMYIFEGLIGFTFAFHIGCFIAQTGSYQTDIQKNGLFYSYLVIATFLALNISLVLLSIDTNLLPAIKSYFITAFDDLKNAIDVIFLKISAVIKK